MDGERFMISQIIPPSKMKQDVVRSLLQASMGCYIFSGTFDECTS